jgi:hypothetical protein
LRAEISHGTFKQTGLRYSSRQFLSFRYRWGRCGSPHSCAARRTARLSIVLTLPPCYRCPLDRLQASRLLPPRSGLDRSDFVLWPGSTARCDREICPESGAKQKRRAHARSDAIDPEETLDHPSPGETGRRQQRFESIGNAFIIQDNDIDLGLTCLCHPASRH